MGGPALAHAQDNRAQARNFLVYAKIGAVTGNSRSAIVGVFGFDYQARL